MELTKKAQKSLNELLNEHDLDYFELLREYDNQGICTSCGEIGQSAEPDAENYKCEECGKRSCMWIGKYFIILRRVIMNIFYTNTNPFYCAYDHCKIHVNKMIIEYAQMLSTAHYVLDESNKGLKPTHINHPCSKWVRQSFYNYKFLYKLLNNLLTIYNNNHNTPHKLTLTVKLLETAPFSISKNKLFTEPPACMPDEFKKQEVQMSYRNYLRHKFNEWRTRTEKRQLEVSWYRDIKPCWVN